MYTNNFSLPTPIESIVVDSREFLVKRDDLIDPHLAGNKFRKLYSLVVDPPKNIYRIISYGGTQSNAMLAIAKMSQENSWEFFYYTKPLSKQQKQQQSGNYSQALLLGMQHFELHEELYRNFVASLSIGQQDGVVVIHQGGANKIAQEGLFALAQEILRQNPPTKQLATPSGTGTTAYFLAKNLPEYTVYTAPTIGNSEYLKTQMGAFGALPKNLVILKPPKKYPFAKPNREFFELYMRLQKSGIEFDLLYAPLLWKMLLEQTKGNLLYIHSGGVSGNKTMLERYRKKGIFAT